jgi:hypothetical protein
VCVCGVRVCFSKSSSKTALRSKDRTNLISTKHIYGQIFVTPDKRSKAYVIVWKKKAHKTVTVVCVLGIVILCNAFVLPF